MRSIVLGSLAVLGFTVVTASSVQASPAVPTLTATNAPVATQITQATPFDVVWLASYGYLQAQGIPSYRALVWDYQAGRVTPKTLVQAAIAANRVSPDALKDQGYLNAVESNLRDLLGTLN